MAETPHSLVLEYLWRFDRRLNDFDAKFDRALDDLHTVKVRVTAVEDSLVGAQHRTDRLEERVERMERRLELVEAEWGLRHEQTRCPMRQWRRPGGGAASPYRAAARVESPH